MTWANNAESALSGQEVKSFGQTLFDRDFDLVEFGSSWNEAAFTTSSGTLVAAGTGKVIVCPDIVVNSPYSWLLRLSFVARSNTGGPLDWNASLWVGSHNTTAKQITFGANIYRPFQADSATFAPMTLGATVTAILYVQTVSAFTLDVNTDRLFNNVRWVKV